MERGTGRANGAGRTTGKATMTKSMAHRKYPKLCSTLVEEPSRLPPSAMFTHMNQTNIAPPGMTAAPQIIEFLNIADFTHQTESAVPVDEPLFQPSPTEITFRQFKAFEKYEVTILLRNNDRFARRVKVLAPDNKHFHLLALTPSANKIAPGMESKHLLTFTPEEEKDYSHDLIVVTEREKFIIPISAIGPRGSFTFPDLVDFAVAPVRAETFKTLLIRNMGTAPASFTITGEEPFLLNPATALVGVEQAVQVTISFMPESVGSVERQLRIEYNTGEVVWMQCVGQAVELAAKLEENTMVMDPTYVQLFSQKSVQLVNDSDQVLRYEWKLLPSGHEETKARRRLAQDASHVTGSGQQEEIENMGFEFRDDCFSISPISGCLYPNAKREVTVTFSPNAAVSYSCTAYCEIEGRQKRLPLHLQAEGVGARVFLSYNVLDVKDVIINSTNTFEVYLENHGDIDCRFEFVAQPTVFGPQFGFAPSVGLLSKGQRQKITITFVPNRLGDFSEEFHWALQGTPRPLVFTVRGCVVGPSFEVDVDELAFNRISVGFLATRHLCIHNTCEIAFRCDFKVPGDGSMLQREFDVIPANCVIPAQGKQKIQVDFIPLSVREYDMQLVMNIDGVGDELLTIPIQCEGVVPEVSAAQELVDFGQVFLRHPYTQMMELVNHCDLPAKFELLPQDELSHCVASFRVDQVKGLIPPNGETVIAVTFMAQRLGKLKLPLQFKIVGSPEPPVEVFLQCVGIGPRLVVKPKEGLQWGATPVLRPSERKLKLLNDSLIPAEYRMFLMKKNSLFRVQHKEGVIAAGDTLEVAVGVTLNETHTFKDDLVVVVTEGEDISIPLTAKGVGTTIYCEHPLDTVHFGNQFTSKPCRREFTLINKGTKVQTLLWTNVTATKARLDAEKALATEKDSEARKKKREDSAPQTVFVVEPDKVSLQPGEQYTLVINAMSSKMGTMSEKISCRATLDKVQKVIFETMLVGEFVNPVLEFSTPALSFDYRFQLGVAAQPLSQTLLIKNVTALPLEVSMKVPMPFSVEFEDINLDVGEQREITVIFDPGWKVDRISDKIKCKLVFTYADHPQKDSVDVVGNIVFPNVKFDRQTVDFGAILNDTSKRMRVKVTNAADVECSYTWALVVDEDEIEKDRKKGLAILPANNVFDILPIRSHLKVGQSETAEFVFYGHPMRKLSATAVCDVEGGPQYSLALTGSAYNIHYRFDTTLLDFKSQPYDRFSEQELWLFNPGKVKFDFVVTTDNVTAPTVVQCTPKAGRVAANDKIKLVVKFYPGMPAVINTSLSVAVAHFPPQVVAITGEGVFPHILVSLPRLEQQEFAARLQEATRLLPPAGAEKPEVTPALGTGRRGNTAGSGASGPSTGQPAPEMLDSRATSGEGQRGPSTPGRNKTAESGGRTSGGRSAGLDDGRSVASSTIAGKGNNPWLLKLEAEADKIFMREQIIHKVNEWEKEMEARRPRVLLRTAGEDLGGATFDLDEPDELADAPLFKTPRRPTTDGGSGDEAAGDGELGGEPAGSGDEEAEEGVEGEEGEAAPADGEAVEGEGGEPAPAEGEGEDGEGEPEEPVPKTPEPIVEECDFEIDPMELLGGDGANLTLRRPMGKAPSSARSSVHDEPSMDIERDPTVSDIDESRMSVSMADHLAEADNATHKSVAASKSGSKAGSKAGSKSGSRPVSASRSRGPSRNVTPAPKRDGLYDLLEADGGVDERGASSGTAMGKLTARDVGEVGPEDAGLHKGVPTWMNMSGFILARYVCDFGNVIKGTHRTKRFRITNVGPSQVSFELNKNVKHALSQSGFGIEPDRVSRLPGAPECESVEFTITFNSARAGVALGPMDMVVPIDLKTGPAVIMHFRANVTIPDVELSTDTLSFGTVYTGQCRTMTVQLVNRKEIPCEWSCLQAIETLKKVSEFTAVPSAGSLQPGEQANVAVTFTPVVDRPFNSKLPLRVQQNNAKKNIRLKAAGAEVKLRFEPSFLDLDPVLPYLTRSQALVELHNDSDVAVEVYSCDLDPVFRQDEEILSRIEGYNEANVMFLPVRNPGQPLQKGVLDADQARADKLEREREREERRQKIIEEGGNPDEIEEEEVGDLLDPIEPTTITILVYGPPCVGKSAVAEELAQRYTVAVLRIDDLLEEVMKEGAEGELAELGQQLRALVEAPPPENGRPKKEPRASTLATIIRTRLMAHDCLRGVIIDGLDSKYVTNQRVVAKAFLIALAPNRKLYMLNLHPADTPPTPAPATPSMSFVPPPTGAPFDSLEFPRAVSPRRVGFEGGDPGGEGAAVLEGAPPGTPANGGDTARSSRGPDSARSGEGGEPAEEQPPAEETEEEKAAREAAALAREEERQHRQAAYDKCYESVLEVVQKEFDINAPPTPREVAPPPEPEKKPKGKGKAAPAPPPEEPEEPEPVEEQIQIKVVMDLDKRPTGSAARLCDRAMEALPEPEPLPGQPRLLKIPPPITQQIVRKPPTRAPRKPITNLVLFTQAPTRPPPTPEEEAALAAAAEVAAAAPAAAPADATPASTSRPPSAKTTKAPPPKSTEPPPPVAEATQDDDGRIEPKSQPTRWVVGPRSSVTLGVQFATQDVGKHETWLSFEAMGSPMRELMLPVRATCAHPSMSNDYRSLFYRKVKSRAEDQIVHRQYVISAGRFEFGPLLLGKSRENYQTAHPDNRERIRITNNGLFDMHVDFFFENDADGKMWLCEPKSMDLRPEEVQELVVYALPEEAGVHEESLICCIKDNPQPTIINLHCTGCKPEVEVDVTEIEFERLLVKRRDNKAVTLRNTSQLPAKWSLLGVSDLGPELTVIPTSGLLEPGQSGLVNIEFNAMQPRTIERVLTLEVFDVDSLVTVPQQQKITIRAEAYNIEIDVQFPKGEDRGLDYGVIKVVDRALESFSLVNKGKYEVGYKFQFKKPQTGELFVVSPSEGVLQPIDGVPPADEAKGAKDKKPAAKGGPKIEPTKIEVAFKSEEEVNLVDNTELNCLISVSGEVIVKLPIKVNVRAVFSKFRILPSKGINFGPLVYNTKKSRTFEIQNKGEFEFTYELVSLTSEYARPGTVGPGTRVPPPAGAAPAPAAAPAGKAAAPGKGKAPAAAGSLTLGNFAVGPSTGVIAPNTDKTVTVDFNAEGAQQCLEVLGIVISERDPSVDTRGMPYELTGESCIPGINASDLDSIFEEQSVVRKLDLASTQTSVFAEEDRVFHFGPVIVAKQVEVRFKISNPTKVSCNVDLAARPAKADALGKPAGKAAAAPAGGEVLAFDVQPQKLTIPMHEHRYVTVFFTPTGLQTFAAKFEAVVENGTDPATSSLTFGLRGDGTLPRVSVTAPTERNAAGLPVVSFNRTLVGKTVTAPVTLCNEGIIPSTVRFESMSAPSSIQFTGRGVQVLMQPKETQTYEVSFTPKEAEMYNADIKLTVLHNQFEATTISVIGEGYVQDVSFESLPHDSTDTLAFEPTPVGVPETVMFTLQNHTPNTYRVELSAHADVSFAPAVAHLLPLSSKEVAATLCSLYPCEHNLLELPFKLTKITHTQGARDWDDRMKTIQWVVDDPAGGGVVPAVSPEPTESSNESPIQRARMRKGGARRVVLVQPEPEHTVSEDGESQLLLKVNAVTDYLRHNTPAGPVAFRDTMMFQQRAFSFPFANTGKAKMDFHWQLHLPDGSIDMGPDPPFTVSPAHGTLAPGESTDVSVTFSPMEVDTFERTLIAEIPHLAFRPVIPEPKEPTEAEKAAAEAAALEAAKGGKGAKPPPAAKPGAKGKEGEGVPVEDTLMKTPMPSPSLVVRGRSQRPLCHFELVESDWLSAGRRPPTMGGPGGKQVPVDAINTRVIEFESLGTRVRNTKRFYVANPTNVAYEYVWECDDSGGAAGMQIAKTFRCLSRRGVVLSGKKAECVFEYTPEEDVILESFWRFTIPEHNISVPFLLVGHVVEPTVMLDHTFVNFNALLLGGKATQTIKIVNKEHIPFSFAFHAASYGADDKTQPAVLRITPASGQVSPNSELPINITFAPTQEKTFNFNVVCNVRSKATRLAVNVKGEGYAVHAQVLLEDPLDGKQTLCSPAPQYNPVEIGHVQVNEKRVRQVILANSGKFPIDVNWQTAKHRALTIMPEACTVPKGEKVTVVIAYHPFAEGAMDGHKATLLLNNGPSYNFLIHGSARRPQLRFAFTEYDFGNCFVVRQGMEPPSVVLRVTNDDRNDISYDCNWENKPWLDVDATPTVLSAGESRDVKISFTPHDVGDIVETLPFEVNGLYTINVTIRGSGCERRVELHNPQQMTSDFGSVRVGSTVSKSLKIVNRSKAKASCSLAATASVFRQLDIRLRPEVPVVLMPKETMMIELVFAPLTRQLPFTQDVIMEVNGVSTVLCVVRGAAAGLEAKLETDTLFFGAVVANSRTTRRLQLENVGDIGTKFAWAAERCQPDFTIEPADGFIGPHDETTFEVTFHPRAISEDIRYDRIPLSLDQGDALFLTLTGMCVAQAPTGEPISFQSPVRQSQKKALPALQNPTDAPWTIKPVIDNDYWVGPETLDIPAGGSAQFTLTYTPLTMTSEAKPAHEGSAFFPLPNGTAVLYQLVGTADSPPPEATLQRTVRAKERHVENLLVKNWSSKPQRFKVTVEVANPSPATIITCADSIDVPAHLERDFKLKFNTYLEGKTQATVTFTNERNGEYLFYPLEITATAPQTLETVAMETTVRNAVSHTFLIDNPLSTAVALAATCDCRDVTTAEGGYTLAPQSSTECEIFYRPLLAEERKATVSFKSAELGVFLYSLNLTAVPAGANRSMQFQAALGTSDVQTFRFLHYLPDKCDYKATVDNPDFVVETPTVAATPAPKGGLELSVDVRYEPSSLGAKMGRLCVASATGGEYLCILNAHCAPPRPQGPIEVKAGGSATINFKNVFSKAVVFTYAVDKAEFSVSAKGGEVKPKETLALQVSFKPAAPGATAMGKLQIACEGDPPWVYYLKGV
mmetsp:Transcript_4036/g.9628  ORF Transcript_4036/g.9628 Transcript_4036/m.9628 type:complete len:4944 (+) Transcript_4036:104-14935(+)